MAKGRQNRFLMMKRISPVAATGR